VKRLMRQCSYSIISLPVCGYPDNNVILGGIERGVQGSPRRTLSHFKCDAGKARPIELFGLSQEVVDQILIRHGTAGP